VQPSPSTEDPLDKLDQLVDAAPEPENAVLTDDARVVRWTGPMFALRRSRYLSTAAAATAALLAVDAWFDCMTTPAAQRWQSFLLCFLVELPLASLCLWLSYHTHQIAERRILLLRRRHRR
jgi:hypothetical protein